MDKKTAEKTAMVALQSNYVLDVYLNQLKDVLEPKEFQLYCKKFGKVMGETLFEILNPIWEEYPDLLPEKMGGSYKTNEEHHKKIFNLIMAQVDETDS